MMLTRDVQVDWNQVPDIGQKLPSGIVQFQIKDYEERMTSAEGVVEKGDRAGQPKIAKYMVVAKLEAVAPEEAQGMTREEFFVLGSDEDPLMQQSKTFIESLGARSLKRMLGDAQVPWSSSLLASLSSSIGAMFLIQVNHRKEKRRDTGEEFVATRLGTSYKIGEKMPQYIPCNLPECVMCVNAKASGVGMAVLGAPTVVPPATPMAPPVTPPVIPPATAPPVPPPSSTGVPPAGTGVASATLQYASGPAVSVPPPAAAQVQAPTQAPQVAAPAPVQTPPVATPPPTPAPAAGTVKCRLCNADVAQAEFAAHVEKCAAAAAAAAQGMFKQEA